MTTPHITTTVTAALTNATLPPRPAAFELLGPARTNMNAANPQTQNVKLIIVPDARAMALKGADEFEKTLREKPNAVLGLATGGTMESIYPEVIRRFQAGKLSFQNATTFNLDEYYPLEADHPQSYRRFMLEKLFQYVDLTLTPIEGARWGQTFVPAAADRQIGEACLSYEQAIVKAGGIDLQILGIGQNGHIAFNEPGASPWSRTRVVKLEEATRRANARFFGSLDEVPGYALTMGIATILEAKRIVLFASGAGKAAAVRAALTGPVNSACPASYLQLHPEVTFIVDRDAAAELDLG
jgi:glucosamine-6-phosphate deaminase